ncbi:MAG: NAD+ synthase [Thermoplasmata archaeon HGW-Thermoplasmata-1]|nr:MAG: NAD+ synthase [Thermoplasmata archaeon HGW-Thermoplasmata-1]
MKVTVAQLNPTVGDTEGNLKKILDLLPGCEKEGSELLVLPELFITGYPPRDLLEKRWFVRRVERALERLSEASCGYPTLGILVGAPMRTGKRHGKGIYNSAMLIKNGSVLASVHKSLLPTYDVFDEDRYFDPPSSIEVVPFNNEILGLSICEDAWSIPELGLTEYDFDPIEQLAKNGATLMINLSASPFHTGKEELRYRIAKYHAARHSVPFVYVNQVGGNDELVFDGRSLCCDKHGGLISLLPSFTECVRTIDTAKSGSPESYEPEERIKSVHDALVLGLRDYAGKCGFDKAVIGLSGGIDSAVVCCLACEALGSGNVLAVSMPGPYSSKESVDDSRVLANRLGAGFKVIPITGVCKSYLEALAPSFDSLPADATEENLQARARGNILMALSNKFGHLLLSCGNKSEMAVGYCTLYGDMSGGLSLISDIPKTMVYELARYINRKGGTIPRAILEKEPSAELRPDQRDSDSLPPYGILDAVLELYLNEGLSADEISERGYDKKTVEWIIRTVDRNEYKRRQAAPGIKVTSKAFGMGRRMPIAVKY